MGDMGKGVTEDYFRPRPTARRSWDAVAPFPRSAWIHPNVPEDDFDSVCQAIWDRYKEVTDRLWPDTAEETDLFSDGGTVRGVARGRGSPEEPPSMRHTLASERTRRRAGEQQNVPDETVLVVQQKFQRLISEDDKEKESDLGDFTLPCPYLPGQRHCRGGEPAARPLSPVMDTEMERNEEKAGRKIMPKTGAEEWRFFESSLSLGDCQESSVSSGGNGEARFLVRPFNRGKPLLPLPVTAERTSHAVPEPTSSGSTPVHHSTQGQDTQPINKEDFPPSPSQLPSHPAACESEDEHSTESSSDRQSSDDGDYAPIPRVRDFASDSDDDQVTLTGSVYGCGEDEIPLPCAASEASCVCEDDQGAGPGRRGNPVCDIDVTRRPITTTKDTRATVATKNKIPAPVPIPVPITATSVPAKLHSTPVPEVHTAATSPTLNPNGEKDFTTLNFNKDFPPPPFGKTVILPPPVMLGAREVKQRGWESPSLVGRLANPNATVAFKTTAPVPTHASSRGVALGLQVKLVAKPPISNPGPPPPLAAPIRQEAYDLLADFPALQPCEKLPAWSYRASTAPWAPNADEMNELIRSSIHSQHSGAATQREEVTPSTCAGYQTPLTFGQVSQPSISIISTEGLKSNNQVSTGGTGADGPGVTANAWASVAKEGMRRAVALHEKARLYARQQTAAAAAANVGSRSTHFRRGAKPYRGAWWHGPRPQHPRWPIRPGFTCPPQYFGAQIPRASCHPGFNPVRFPPQQVGPHCYRHAPPGMTSQHNAMSRDGPRRPRPDPTRP